MSDTDWTADASATEETSDETPHEEGLAFNSLPAFVEDFFLEVAARHSLPEHWCVQWWDHEEAVLRLEALWDAFEALRLEPGTGTAVWIRDYLDPTVAALTGDNSPFRRCKAKHGEHLVEDPWPRQSPPEGMFRVYDGTREIEDPSTGEGSSI